MSKRTPSGGAGNVFQLDEWRHRTKLAKTSAPTSRGDLFVKIDNDGDVDFDVKNVTLSDAPSMLLAALVLCSRLARQIHAGEMA